MSTSEPTGRQETRDPRSGLLTGRVFIALAWLAMLTTFVVVGRYLLPSADDRIRSARPRYDRLSDAYEAFRIQHINPFYLFSFPFDDEAREQANNEICSVDRDGFRGPGPDRAGDRKLAFLLGGSSAFGHYASSDVTTITGYLNLVQDEYFFVNAGVPSWNTTQELFRLVFQLLEFKPRLLVTYDGANDAALALRHFTRRLEYPPGTPESFDKLQALVDNIRAKRGIKDRLVSVWSPAPRPEGERRMAGEFSDAEMMPHVDKYLLNLSTIHKLSEALGIRHLAVFQPVSWLHANVPAEQKEDDRTLAFKRFHDLVFERQQSGIELLDFARIFDQRFEQIPIFDSGGTEDLAEDAIFVDAVHLYDPGNRLIAEEIAAELGREHGRVQPVRPSRDEE